jgi:hypothetical protein
VGRVGRLQVGQEVGEGDRRAAILRDSIHEGEVDGALEVVLLGAEHRQALLSLAPEDVAEVN